MPPSSTPEPPAGEPYESPVQEHAASARDPEGRVPCQLRVRSGALLLLSAGLSPPSVSTTWCGALTTCYKRHVRGPCSFLHLNLDGFRWLTQTPHISHVTPQPLRRKVKVLKDPNTERYPTSTPASTQGRQASMGKKPDKK